MTRRFSLYEGYLKRAKRKLVLGVKEGTWLDDVHSEASDKVGKCIS